MKALKLEECTTLEINTMPDGYYLVDGHMIATKTAGMTNYLPIPMQPHIKDVLIEIDETKEPEKVLGTVSEDFALKIAAMAFERDDIPRQLK